MLVPVKDFRQAKARLAGHLTPAERHHLAETMAARVLAAGAPQPTFVVCDDVAVERFAREHGASPIVRRGYGLNGAVTSAVDELASAGCRQVIVIHSDVPLATSAALAALAGWPGVTLVPDRRDDGTNVAVVPASIGFRFAYGAGSFRRHGAEAIRLGLPLRVLRSPELGWDVDLPDDLIHPLLADLTPERRPTDALAGGRSAPSTQGDPASPTVSPALTEGARPSLPTSPVSPR